MGIKVADYLIKQLNKLGIEEIFGLPGDFNFEIVESIENNENVKWIGCTNELNAGYAADGYSRIKGYGAILTTYGVGELSAFNAVAGCMAENVPVIKIVGVPAIKHIKNRTLLHHNLDSANYYAFQKAFSNIVEETLYLDFTDPKEIKEKIDNLLNTMVKTKKPVYLALPMDVCSIILEDSDYKIIEEKSDEKNLSLAIDEIIKEIKSSKKPCVIGDILTTRFQAKKELTRFLEKTKIPSASFLRGMDLINYKTKNYLGVYCGKIANPVCYNYINTSDCVILSGSVISDLNTLGFDFKFNLEKSILINPKNVVVKNKVFENVLIKDLLKNLEEKIDFEFKENLETNYYYEKSSIEKEENLTCEYIYTRLNEFLKEDDIFVTEVGLVPFGAVPMKFPKNVSVQNQLLWGSIGWATPCLEGCALADKSRRSILVTGDGSHQLTAQEVSTMLRNNLKPIIFVINNSGYTVERILCDDPEYDYNNIAQWDYSKLPEVFRGDCFSTKVKTNKEFDEVLGKIEKLQKEKMCYVELVTDYMDIPKLAKAISKH